MGERHVVSAESERFWSDAVPYWTVSLDLPRVTVARTIPQPLRKRGRATGLPQPRGSP